MHNKKHLFIHGFNKLIYYQALPATLSLYRISLLLLAHSIYMKSSATWGTAENMTVKSIIPKLKYFSNKRAKPGKQNVTMIINCFWVTEAIGRYTFVKSALKISITLSCVIYSKVASCGSGFFFNHK